MGLETLYFFYINIYINLTKFNNILKKTEINYWKKI